MKVPLMTGTSVNSSITHITSMLEELKDLKEQIEYQLSNQSKGRYRKTSFKAPPQITPEFPSFCTTLLH